MFNLIENISDQRLENIIAGADEVKARLKDFLRNGLLRLAQNVDEQTDLLRRRLIDCQAPGLASMITMLTKIDFSSDFWKEQFVSTLSQVYMTASALKNIKNLEPVWQNEILMLSGVSFPQQQVFLNKPIKDIWLVLATTREPYNSMTVKKTWLIGQYSNRFAVHVQFLANNYSDEFKVTPGNSVEANFYFYDGIHSMRVLFKNFAIIRSAFSPKAFSGIDTATRIFRRALTDNPFMQFIPLILTDVFLSKINGKLYLIDSKNRAISLSINSFEKLNLLTYTGGKSFSCFVFVYQYYCRILSVWADDRFYTLDYEIN